MAEHPLTDELIDSIAQFNSDLRAEEILNRENDMRGAYDRAVEDVIKVMQESAWHDFGPLHYLPHLGELHYPVSTGVKNIGDAIKRQLYRQEDNS